MAYPSRDTIPAWVRHLAVLGVFAWTAIATASPWDFSFEWVNFTSGASALTMALEGNRLYLSNYERGKSYNISIFDVSNPRIPVKIQEYQSALPVESIAVCLVVINHIVYVPTYNAGVDVIDTRDLSRIRKIASIPAVEHTLWLANQDNSLYVGVQPPGAQNPNQFKINIYDVRIPASSRLLSTITDNPHYFVVDNNLLVTQDGHLYDVADPLHPKESPISQTLLYHANRLFMKSSYLYSVTGNGTIDMYKVSYSSGLHRLASYTTPASDSFGHIFAQGSLLFAGGNWGLNAFDTRQPIPSDFLRGAYYVPSNVRGLAVNGEYIYALDELNGLIVFRYTGVRPDGPVYNAKIIGYEGPRTLFPGQQVTAASLVVKNTGPDSWVGGAGYKLAVRDDPGHLWDLPYPRVNVPSGTEIKPGATYRFPLQLKAPATEGTYHLRLQMIREYHQYFGEPSTLTFTVTRSAQNAADGQSVMYP